MTRIYKPYECKSNCETCIEDMKEQCEYWAKVKRLMKYE
jgi:hypothetical protein